jgi:acyl-CoA synthetase (AMP-forming)/AMP-acid ligase II
MQSVQSNRLIVDSDLFSFAVDLNGPAFDIVKIVDEISPQHADVDDSMQLWSDYPTSDREPLAIEARTGIFACMHTSGSTGMYTFVQCLLDHMALSRFRSSKDRSRHPQVASHPLFGNTSPTSPIYAQYFLLNHASVSRTHGSNSQCIS